MNDPNTIASLVLSGAGEELFTIDVPHTPIAPTSPKPSADKPRRNASIRVASLITAVAPCAMSTQTLAAGFGVDAVPDNLAMLVWIPLLALTVGCAIGLLALIVAQRPRRARRHTRIAAAILGSAS